MPKLFIFDAFTLLIREKTVANYALLRCKTFSLKIWLCKIFDKYHVWLGSFAFYNNNNLSKSFPPILPNFPESFSFCLDYLPIKLSTLGGGGRAEQ